MALHVVHLEELAVLLCDAIFALFFFFLLLLLIMEDLCHIAETIVFLLADIVTICIKGNHILLWLLGSVKKLRRWNSSLMPTVFSFPELEGVRVRDYARNAIVIVVVVEFLMALVVMGCSWYGCEGEDHLHGCLKIALEDVCFFGGLRPHE